MVPERYSHIEADELGDVATETLNDMTVTSDTEVVLT